jgi:hypothetical protein
MKIRTDFVTNSSSSSYLLVLAEVFDEAALRDWLDETGVSPERYGSNRDFIIGTPKELLERNTWDTKSDGVSIVSSENHAIERTITVHPDSTVFVLNLTNGEGDVNNGTWCTEEDGVDYDKFTVKDLPIAQQNVYNQIHVANNGLKNIQIEIGVKRDG